MRDLLNAAGAVDRGGPEKLAVTDNIIQLANNKNSNNNSSMRKDMKEGNNNNNSTSLLVKISGERAKVTIDSENGTKTTTEKTKTPQVIVNILF